jgi:uncharacterized membrane protein
MPTIKNILLVVMIIAYILAGTNHFKSPGGYIKIIPPYLSYPAVLNILAGVFEIAFGVMLMFPATRPFAAWGIVLMLIAFMPAHIYMIQKAPMKMGGLTITPLIAWARIPFQFLFAAWAWWYTKK